MELRVWRQGSQSSQKRIQESRELRKENTLKIDRGLCSSIQQSHRRHMRVRTTSEARERIIQKDQREECLALTQGQARKLNSPDIRDSIQAFCRMPQEWGIISLRLNTAAPIFKYAIQWFRCIHRLVQPSPQSILKHRHHPTQNTSCPLVSLLSAAKRLLGPSQPVIYFLSPQTCLSWTCHINRMFYHGGLLGPAPVT